MAASSTASALDPRLAPLLDDGIVDDPWLNGRPRLSADPVVLRADEAAALAEAACAVAMLIDAAVQALAGRADLQRALGMDDSLIAIAALDAPRWLGLARADVFFAEGQAHPQVCELNADTPTGLAECVALGSIAARGTGLADPSARLRERWLEMVRGCLDEAADPVVGIVDATEMTEDLGHVRLLTRWLEGAGLRVVRGSPFNLHACPGRRVGLFGVACDVIVRHYKTDWWAERASVWTDEAPPPDADGLDRELALIADAQAAGTLAVINPWGAAIAQNKRLLALPWEHPGLFDAEILDLASRHLPETRFVDALDPARLIAERADWVLKSDYGCEGDEVLIGADTAPELWAASLRCADPRRWIAQRAFRPRRDDDGRIANHGVYLVGGRPSGIYTRLSAGATGVDALSCPTLLRADATPRGGARP